MINIIWFLTGFIVGIFTLLLVLVCYEEHLVIKVEKDRRYEQPKRKERSLKIS